MYMRNIIAAATLGIAILALGGCNARGSQYMSGTTIENPTGEVLTFDYCQRGLATCNRILAQDPGNRYAAANKSFYEGRIRAMEKYDRDAETFASWYTSLTTDRRVQLNDWVRMYESLRHLGYSREDAAVKATESYGVPTDPPLTPPSGEKYYREAFDTLRTK